jgi:hypothetical protein
MPSVPWRTRLCDCSAGFAAQQPVAFAGSVHDTRMAPSIVTPTKVGIHHFLAASRKVMDDGPVSAMMVSSEGSANV